MRQGTSTAPNGSYFVLIDTMILPPRYTLLGRVSAGLTALQHLSPGATTLQPDAQEPALPLQPAWISAIQVELRC